MFSEKTIFSAFLLFFILCLNSYMFSQSENENNANAENIFTIAIDSKISTLDPIGSVIVDYSSEQISKLMFDTLITRNEKLAFVGELANQIKTLEKGGIIEFVLQENVQFHNGKSLTSTDVKYTLEKLFEIDGAKSFVFYENINGEKKPLILDIETPDAKTIRLKLAKPFHKEQVLSGLINVPIIPEGSKIDNADFSTTPPIGTGAYKFVSFNSAQQIIKLEAHENYWRGKPAIQKIRVKVVSDVDTLVENLKSEEIDITRVTNLPPEKIRVLAQDLNLKVKQFDGTDIHYLGFNTQAKPLNNVKVRQAIAYAIDREKIIKELLDGRAKIAHSILPEKSWAYAAGKKYNFDPDKARQLLNEAGFKDADGDGKLEMPEIILKFSSGNSTVIQYAQIIQNQLSKFGIPIIIETVEFQTLLLQLQRGKFQITVGRWVGGNQDPAFLFDLFVSSEIPTEIRLSRNRSRYRNKEVDLLLSKAVKETDENKAKELFVKAQEIISDELPLLPLWYPSTVIAANQRVIGIEFFFKNDLSFVRNLTLLP